MRWDELRPGLPVRITDGFHTGKVIAVGTFEGGPYRIGALVDIGEPLLVIIVDPEALEEAPEEPLSPGWEEFDI